MVMMAETFRPPPSVFVCVLVFAFIIPPPHIHCLPCRLFIRRLHTLYHMFNAETYQSHMIHITFRSLHIFILFRLHLLLPSAWGCHACTCTHSPLLHFTINVKKYYSFKIAWNLFKQRHISNKQNVCKRKTLKIIIKTKNYTYTHSYTGCNNK